MVGDVDASDQRDERIDHGRRLFQTRRDRPGRFLDFRPGLDDLVVADGQRRPAFAHDRLEREIARPLRRGAGGLGGDVTDRSHQLRIERVEQLRVARAQ
jgi:hypothetical protein